MYCKIPAHRKQKSFNYRPTVHNLIHINSGHWVDMPEVAQM